MTIKNKNKNKSLIGRAENRSVKQASVSILERSVTNKEFEQIKKNFICWWGALPKITKKKVIAHSLGLGDPGEQYIKNLDLREAIDLNYNDIQLSVFEVYIVTRLKSK